MDSIQKIHNDLFEHLRTKYPDLRFKLRQSNRYSRLDKGYWFLGNEVYLGTSFWEGTDWQNKTYNIMLGIELSDAKKPKVYLEFVANDNEDKAGFFSKIALPLRMNRVKRGGNEINKWWKNYEAEHYLDAVDLMITTDKSIIDAFIASSQSIDLFPEIDERDFKKRLSYIQSRQAHKKNLEIEIIWKNDMPNGNKKPIILEKLRLKNIAQYNEASIKFHDRITCFIGENGSGKSTVLRAMLLALIGVDQNRYLNDNNDLANSLINLLKIKGSKEGEAQYSNNGEIELKVKYQSNPSIVKFIWDGQGRPILHDEGNFETQIDENGNLNTLVMGFSQIQGVPNKSNARLLNKPNVGDMLPLLANEPDGRGEALQKWLMALDHDASNKEKSGKISLERKLINRMFHIISAVTGQELTFLSVNAQKEIIWIGIDGKTFPLSLISQGFNNVFSWVGYFMKRLSETAPEGTEDPTQLPAICLIDEIDTYLHPRWQQTIVPALLEHFPKTQFIITTHSPIVVSNLEEGKLYKLNDGQVNEIPFGYFGKDYGMILEAVMGTPPRNEKSRKDLADLFDLIDREDFDAARQKLSELEEEYPGEPELSRAETLLSFLEA